MITVSISFGQTKKALAPEDLYKIKNVTDPQISPDGKWIAYTVSVPSIEKNNFNSDIWLIPVDGGTPIQLTNSPKGDYSPRWSPSSKNIAFISSRSGKANLYIITIDGGEAVQLTFADHSLSAPIWSKDGKWLFFPANLSKESEYIEWDTDIYRINIQTGKTDILTDHEGGDSNPVISPNGKHIAYLRFASWDPPPPKQIIKAYIMDIDGKNKRSISGEFDRDVQNIRWDAKGKGLFFQYDDQGNKKITEINRSGRIPTSIE